MNLLRIATRKSHLAMWQARHVADLLQDAWPQLTIELVPITTSGDKRLDSPLYEIGGKGLFLKELEQAMLCGKADIAVHSAKDVPAQLPDRFCITATLARGDPRDALVYPIANHNQSLTPNAVIGTSSIRRAVQLTALWPHIRIQSIRGNVHTRLAKLDSGKYHAIALACAGLDRLAMTNRINQRVSTEHMLPAIGQGMIVVESVCDNQQVQDFMQPLCNADAQRVLACERAFGKYIGADCHTAVAAHAELLHDSKTIRMRAMAVAGEQIDPNALSQSVDQLSAQHVKSLATRLVKTEIQGTDESTIAEQAVQQLAAQGVIALANPPK